MVLIKLIKKINYLLYNLIKENNLNNFKIKK